MPTFHTRVMRAEFKSKFDNVMKMSPPIHLAIYQFLTDKWTSSCRVTKAVDMRMKIALEAGGPDPAVGLREFNTRKPENFNDFWSALAEYTEEHVAAQECHHGELGYMPMYCST